MICCHEMRLTRQLSRKDQESAKNMAFATANCVIIFDVCKTHNHHFTATIQGSTCECLTTDWVNEQDMNAGNSCVTKCQSQKVPKHDSGHFRLSEQHANGTYRLTRYDFLLVFYSNLLSRWNCSRVKSRRSQQPKSPRKNSPSI